ncbi:MAG: response regulator [Bacteroidota bacterium]
MNEQTLEGKKILVVEDEPSNYDLIQVFLKKLKPELSWVKDGKDAVELIDQEKFDIILMDIQLPVMNGLDATKLIKQKDTSIPVIAQTAYAMSQDRQKALNAGCDDYLPKPMKRQHLVDLIFKHIR